MENMSVFKIPKLPTRYRRDCTRSTYNNAEISSQKMEIANNNFKKIEEQFEVLKKICQPEEVEQLSKEMIEKLNSVCYEKLAEQILQPNSRGFIMGNYSVCSTNTRPSTYSIPDRTSEQVHRGASSTLNVGHNTRFFSVPSAVVPVAEKPCRSEVRAPGLCVPTKVSKPTLPDTSVNRNTRKKATPLKDLEVLPSDDDTLSDIFGKLKPATKSTAKSKQNANKRALSISLNRVETNTVPKVEASTSRKRRAQQDLEFLKSKKPSPCSKKNLVPSPDTTTAESVSRKVTEPTKRSTRNNSVIKKTGKENKEAQVKTSKPKNDKARAEDKKKKHNGSLSKKVAAAGTESHPGFQEMDDASLFNDVSSIVGTESMQILSNSVAKNSMKHKSTHTSEVVSGIFSPFASNVRSTSGLSAISTPLSKTVAKNVLSKRLKKPNVISELKDQFIRKSRKRPVKKDVIPLEKEESSENTESDCEASDFSD